MVRTGLPLLTLPESSMRSGVDWALTRREFCSTRACMDFSDWSEVSREATEMQMMAMGTTKSNQGMRVGW